MHKLLQDRSFCLGCINECKRVVTHTNLKHTTWQKCFESRKWYIGYNLHLQRNCSKQNWEIQFWCKVNLCNEELPRPHIQAIVNADIKVCIVLISKLENKDQSMFPIENVTQASNERPYYKKLKQPANNTQRQCQCYHPPPPEFLCKAVVSAHCQLSFNLFDLCVLLIGYWASEFFKSWQL